MPDDVLVYKVWGWVESVVPAVCGHCQSSDL